MRPAMRKASVDRSVVHVSTAGRKSRRDRVVGEEPLEIRIVGPDGNAASVAITMRTPGHDFALAVGFLITEGVLKSAADVRRVEYCTRGVGLDQLYNIVTVHSSRPVPDGISRRALLTSASCGICGTATLDDLAASIATVQQEPGDFQMNSAHNISVETVVALPDRLRVEQAVFERTGGLHGVGLFNFNGHALVVREDIGRHNAVDKVVGEAILHVSRKSDSTHTTDAPIVLPDSILAVSGRVSYEIVQKAAMVAIPMIVAVSAPSSLAIDAAQRFGITLLGFVRNGSANIYTHAYRVTS
jgi:FdhD protein